MRCSRKFIALAEGAVMSQSPSTLVEIPRNLWPQLRDLYVAKQCQSTGFNCIQNFIEWVEKEPSENIKCFSLNGNWKEDGTFVIVVDFGFEPKGVYFNTLSENVKCIGEAIRCLQCKTGEFLFCGYGERLIPAVEEFDAGERDQTIWYYASKDLVKTFTTEPPPGIKLSSLSIENAEQVNEVWPHRAENSVNFVRRMIKYNLSIGAYDEEGNLVAWCLRLPTGSLGLLQVVNTQKRLGLGSLMVQCLSKKISNVGGEVMAPVVVANTPSRRMFEKLGFKQIDNVFWSISK